MEEGQGQHQDPGQQVIEPAGEGWREIYLKGSELYDDPTLATIKEVPALAKLAVETRRTLGRYGTEKGVLRPKDGAPPEEWDQFHKAMGRPETAEAYEITAPEELPEGFPYSPELEGHFKQWAFEEGLSATQAKNLFNKYLKVNLEQFTAQNEAQTAAFKKDQDAITAKLREAWGDKYDENVSAAQTAMREFFPPGSRALMALDKIMGDDPDLIQMAYNIGKRMGEASLVKGSSKVSASLETRKQELAEHPAFMDPSHGEHGRVVKEFNDVLEQIVKAEEEQGKNQG